MSTANALVAISLMNDILELVVNGAEAMRAAGGVISRAAAEGRDVSQEELDSLRQVRARVLLDLHDEILRRQGG